MLAPEFELKIVKNPANCSSAFRPSELNPTITLANEIAIKNTSRVDPNLVLNIWIFG
ncbi:MAG: hypothetical protein ACI86M_000039 [Saprospiraceae bacterium]|jgi:hypothetical protein